MLGRKMPGTASRCESTREASCRTLSLIFGAPSLWVDPTSLGARSSTPQRVNRLRGTKGQEHSEHEAMFTARTAAHESSRVLDSPGSSTRNTEAPPGFLCRRRGDTNNPALLPLLRVPLPQSESTTDDLNEAVVGEIAGQPQGDRERDPRHNRHREAACSPPAKLPSSDITCDIAFAERCMPRSARSSTGHACC